MAMVDYLLIKTCRWLNSENCLINRDNWTSNEDKHLLLLIQKNGIHNWSYIAQKLETNRTPFQCLARYQRSLNASILKREWTEDEDAQLRSAVESFGESNWQAVASVLEGRTGTQCSNRSVNINNLRLSLYFPPYARMTLDCCSIMSSSHVLYVSHEKRIQSFLCVARSVSSDYQVEAEKCFRLSLLINCLCSIHSRM